MRSLISGSISMCTRTRAAWRSRSCSSLSASVGLSSFPFGRRLESRLAIFGSMRVVLLSSSIDNSDQLIYCLSVPAGAGLAVYLVSVQGRAVGRVFPESLAKGGGVPGFYIGRDWRSHVTFESFDQLFQLHQGFFRNPVKESWQDCVSLRPAFSRHGDLGIAS